MYHHVHPDLLVHEHVHEYRLTTRSLNFATCLLSTGFVSAYREISQL